MGIVVCDKCEAISSGETTVGFLIKEGDILHKEGVRSDREKIMQAMKKYNEACNILKNNNCHADCINKIDNEYRNLYRSLQGSRA